MDVKSKYYKSWPEYMEENNIKPEDSGFIAPAVQSMEEMMYGFVMFLLM